MRSLEVQVIGVVASDEITVVQVSCRDSEYSVELRFDGASTQDLLSCVLMAQTRARRASLLADLTVEMDADLEVTR